jgi:tetratricopeptide (TPR) repeat protein
MAVTPIPLLFPIPSDEDDFEDLCVDLLRVYWNRPKLERFGRRGFRQFGIDILDLGGLFPLHAAQCKLREYGKTLSPDTISTEVAAAREFSPPLGKYGILTTAKVSTHAQKRVLELNQKHNEEGLFEIELLTWDKLCRLLQEYDTVREAFYGVIAVNLTSRIGRGVFTAAQQWSEVRAAVGESSITAEIDEARDAIRRHEFQIALLLLNRLQQRGDTVSITDFHRFRITSNLGFAEVGLGRLESAAQHFLESFKWEPQIEQARINEVFAYVLKGDYGTAYAKAQALRPEYPDSGRLASYWVLSAPSSVSLTTLEASLSAIAKADADALIALARRALLELDIDRSLAYAETAAEAAPTSAHPRLVIAQGLMGWIVTSENGISNPPMSRAELEQKLEEALAETLRLAEAEHDDRVQVDALVIRTDLRLLQKRMSEAESDAQSAYKIDPDNVRVMIALSQIHAAGSRMDQAIQLLERAHRTDPLPDVEFMYGRALLQRGTPQDLDTAVSVLSAIEIASWRPEARPSIATLATQAMVRKKDPASATTYLDRVSPVLDVIALSSLRGYIAQSEGRSSEALGLAIEARSNLSEASSADTKEFIARLFMLLDHPAEALPLFQGLFDQATSSFDSGQLLDCAARLHRDDVVIATCAKLQERGVGEWAVVSFEVGYLQKYSREKAVLRLDQFLELHPGHKLATLMKSVIGVQSQRPDLVKGRISDLPAVEELSVDNIISAVHVLRFSGAGNETVDYAYRYLRLHFDDIRAHRAFMLSLMPGDPSIDIPPTLQVVQTGAAVCLQEEINGSIRWFVLEETNAPNAEFEELSADSPLAVELANKRVGDTVILAKGQMHSRSATIRQIMPKYVRRYQDCFSEMQLRFGNAASVESVPLGSSEVEMGKSLEKILESLKRRSAAISHLRKIYDELPVSLHIFGERFGKNAYIALLSLAQEEGQSIKCSFGNPEEREQGTVALHTSLVVVVDLTAIGTLRMIGTEHLLETKRFRFQMTEASWNELQETLLGGAFFGAAGGTIGQRDGVPTFTEESADDKAKSRLQDQEFLNRVKKAVEIVPVMELATLEPARREPLEKMFGQYGAESMMLAANPGFVLWTDDLVQAQLAATEFGVKRAWTQLVAEQLAKAGQITAAHRDGVAAALVGMGYVATSFDSAALVRAVEMSDAKAWRWPLKQFVEVFRNPEADLPALLGIFVDFLAKLYLEPLPPESRCRVVTAFLDVQWHNVSLRLPMLRLRKTSRQIFGLNLVGQTQFDQCFDQWYGAVAEKIVGP